MWLNVCLPLLRRFVFEDARHSSECFDTLNISEIFTASEGSRITPLGAGLLLAALNLLLNGAMAYRSATWFSSSAGMDLFSDYEVLVSALMFQPIVIATFCWLLLGIQNLYTGIAKEGGVEAEMELQRSYEHLRVRLQSPWLIPVAIVWAAFSCVAEYYVFFHPLTIS